LDNVILRKKITTIESYEMLTRVMMPAKNHKNQHVIK